MSFDFELQQKGKSHNILFFSSDNESDEEDVIQGRNRGRKSSRGGRSNGC